MNTNSNRRPESALLGAGIVLLVINVLHILDHVRQGRALAGVLTVVGALGVTAAVVAILLALKRSPLAAPFDIMVGFGTLLGLAAVHLAPRWSVFSDPYSAAHVDGLSWANLIAFMLVGAGVGIAGSKALRRRASSP